MKQTNDQIYRELRKNGREKLTNISRRTRIPVSTIFEKIKRAEAIKRYTVLLDYEYLGYPCQLHSIIKVDKIKKEELKIFLKHNHNINTIYRINNGYDFIIEGIFKSIMSAENFLEQLTDYDLQDIKTHYILEEVAKEEFMTDI